METRSGRLLSALSGMSCRGCVSQLKGAWSSAGTSSAPRGSQAASLSPRGARAHPHFSLPASATPSAQHCPPKPPKLFHVRPFQGPPSWPSSEAVLSPAGLGGFPESSWLGLCAPSLLLSGRPAKSTHRLACFLRGPPSPALRPLPGGRAVYFYQAAPFAR